MWFSGNLPDQRCNNCKETPAVETKIIETIPIKNSSNISAVSYTNTGSLIVQFNNGGEYIYKSVPKEIYEELAKSESAGKYLTAAVKGKYEYEKLDKTKSAELRTVKTLDTLEKALCQDPFHSQDSISAQVYETCPTCKEVKNG
jgi:hypothetical protein